VQHVEATELVDGDADRRAETVGIGDVGADGDRFVAGKMGSFLAGPGVDLGDGDLGAFAREEDGGGRADPAAATGDESSCLRAVPSILPFRSPILKRPGSTIRNIVPAS
jgi:hypothetical protein